MRDPPDEEARMDRKYHRVVRWLALATSGAVVFQAASCDLVLQTVQTGLLATVTGILYYLARNV